jgi:DNA-binding response OmpR family regulator
VVDDEPDAVELVEFNLKSAGYDVVSAPDGEEALRKARALLPSLIILDLMLPEVDGVRSLQDFAFAITPQNVRHPHHHA